MYCPYDEMPGHSRLWIYAASRTLTEAEERTIGESITGFCEQWAAHGRPLRASWKIHRQRFILLLADEQAAGASGCSIDASTREIRSLGEKIGVDLFDRRVPFIINDEVVPIGLGELKTLLADGAWSADTPVLPMHASTRLEWEEGPVPAASTWLNRYLPDVAHDPA